MINLIYEEESYRIRGAIYELYSIVGSGFLEAVYQECLYKELERRKIPFLQQPEISLEYKGFRLKQTYKPDFICFDKIVIELKAVKILIDDHRAQIHNYLKISGIELGFLVNFGHHPKVEIERVLI